VFRSVAPARNFTASLVRLACGIRPISPEDLPASPFVIFANHSSHLDFASIWAALPADARSRSRPVAGRDYWEKTPLRRWLARSVFDAILIERMKVTVATNPLEPMLSALAGGSSLIVFPEGTRSVDGKIQPFKGGLYHIAQSRPTTPFVPVLLDNLNRILPKGEFLALPLIATTIVGSPLLLHAGETKAEFLFRAKQSLESLRSQ
jgi:1-acyl-sn-glycerol-3-phosphate acyltransferase